MIASAQAQTSATPPPGFPTLPAPGSGTFFGQDLSTDQSVHALTYIFGDVINQVLGQPSTGAGPTGLADMIGMLNAGVLFLGAVYLAWITLVGTLYTADKGEVFGQRWSAVWLPIKVSLGTSALFPAVGGYSWLQMFVFWVLLNGIGLGNLIMEKGLDSFQQNQFSFRHIPTVDPNTVTLGYDIVRSAYCAQAINQVSRATLYALTGFREVEQKNIADRGVDSVLRALAERAPSSWLTAETRESYQNRAGTYSVELPQMAMQKAVATVQTPRDGLNEGQKNIVANPAGQPASAIMSWLPTGDITESSRYYWGFSEADYKKANDRKKQFRDAARPDYCGQLVYTRITGYQDYSDVIPSSLGMDPLTKRKWEQEKAMAARMKPDNDLQSADKTAFDQWVNELNCIGRTLARHYDPYINPVNNNGTYKACLGATVTKTKTFSPVYTTDKAPAFAEPPASETTKEIMDDFNNINQMYTAALKAIDDQYQRVMTSAVEEAKTKQYWEEFTDMLRTDGWLGFGAYYVKLSEARANVQKTMSRSVEYIPSDPNIWDFYRLDDENIDMRPAVAELSDAERNDLFSYFGHYYDFHRQLQVHAGVSGTTNRDPGPVVGLERESAGKDDGGIVGKGLEQMVKVAAGGIKYVINEGLGTASLQELEGPPPLLRIRDMGEELLSLSGVFLIVSATGALVDAASMPLIAAGAAVGGWGAIIAATVAELSGWAAGIAKTLGWWLFIVGGFLSKYLPMVPFLVWVGAVIAFFLMAVESIIAAPLWAIAFLEPGTQDGPGGKNAQGWYLIMNVFLRPGLLVVAMIAVMLLSDVVLGFLNIYMGAAFNMTGGSDSSWLALCGYIWASIVYIVFMLSTMHGLYSLIHRIPDNIMEWLGVGSRHLGDLSDEAAVRGLVLATVGRGQGGLGRGPSLANIQKRVDGATRKDKAGNDLIVRGKP